MCVRYQFGEILHFVGPGARKLLRTISSAKKTVTCGCGYYHQTIWIHFITNRTRGTPRFSPMGQELITKRRNPGFSHILSRKTISWLERGCFFFIETKCWDFRPFEGSSHSASDVRVSVARAGQGWIPSESLNLCRLRKMLTAVSSPGTVSFSHFLRWCH